MRRQPALVAGPSNSVLWKPTPGYRPKSDVGWQKIPKLYGVGRDLNAVWTYRGIVEARTARRGDWAGGGDRQERTVTPDATALDGSRQTTAGGSRFTTGVDQEIAIDVVAETAGGAVSRINGNPISTAAPVDVAGAWVQLREDGRLTVNPNAGYTGRIAFDCTIVGADARPSIHRTVVDVVGDPAGAARAEGAAMDADIRLAEIAASDTVLGTDALAQAGLYGDMFKIVGNTLYLRAGVEFDFGTKSTLSIDVLGEGAPEAGHGHDGSALLSDMDGDTLIFATGFGDAAGKPDGGPREVIDVSSTGYATFQDLLDSGALVQHGPDVVLTIDPADPLHSDKITLRGIDLSALSDSDFKF
jgi:hypothetical protein